MNIKCRRDEVYLVYKKRQQSETPLRYSAVPYLRFCGSLLKTLNPEPLNPERGKQPLANAGKN